MATSKGKYVLLPKDDLEQMDSKAGIHQHQTRRLAGLVELGHWMLHALSIMTVAALAWLMWHDNRQFEESCARRHNIWSPAMDLRDQTTKKTFFGTFDAPTPFKGSPNEETEAAWDTMWNYNTVNLTAEQMIELGRPLDSIQYPDEFGGGYLAQVEAIHQLHCLHIIWQEHHYEAVPLLAEQKAKRPSYYERHFQHCIDIIRQRLMCTADPGLVTFRWVEGEDTTPEPDFNTPHMCGDWDRLVSWNNDHAASVDVDTIHWRAPAGVKKLPEAP